MPENFQPSNLQVTIISVPNTASNVIPAHARATLNVRYNDLWSRPKMESWINDTIAKAAAEIGAVYEVSSSGTGDVFLTKPGTLVETLKSAVQAVTGRTPALTTGGGTSDAHFIDLCPVVEFGLVNATIHRWIQRLRPRRPDRDLRVLPRKLLCKRVAQSERAARESSPLQMPCGRAVRLDQLFEFPWRRGRRSSWTP